MAQRDPRFAEFAGRVKLFYQALQKKDWPTTYEMRTASFRHDVTKDLYLKETADREKNWSLDSYKVLNVSLYGGSNGDRAAQVIMEFNENGMVSYSCAWWKKESDSWLCEEPGVNVLGVLHSTRAPDCYRD